MWWRRWPTRGFCGGAGYLLCTAGGFFLGAGFFFHAARGFLSGRAHHESLAFTVFPLALRFSAAVFFQHPLPHGEFRLGQGPARAGGAGGLAPATLAATGTLATRRATGAACGRRHRHTG